MYRYVRYVRLVIYKWSLDTDLNISFQCLRQKRLNIKCRYNQQIEILKRSIPVTWRVHINRVMFLLNKSLSLYVRVYLISLDKQVLLMNIECLIMRIIVFIIIKVILKAEKMVKSFSRIFWSTWPIKLNIKEIQKASRWYWSTCKTKWSYKRI